MVAEVAVCLLVAQQSQFLPTPILLCDAGARTAEDHLASAPKPWPIQRVLYSCKYERLNELRVGNESSENVNNKV